MMKYAALALFFLLPGCSARSDADAEIAARDARIGELSDANAELERRVSKLEKTSAALSQAAINQIERKVPVPAAARSVPDFDRDRLETRVEGLEREAGKMPRP